MKTSKKLVALGVLSTLMITGCNASSIFDEDTKKDDDNKQEEAITLKSISLNKESITLVEDASEVLIVTFDPAEGLSNLQKALTWTSENEEIATVTSTGKVTGRSKGTTKIVVASISDPTIKAECEVTVEKKDTTVHVESISIDEEDKDTGVEIAKGATRALKYTLVGENNKKPTDQEVIWTTSAPAVATVDQNGYVTGVSKGTATITVTSHEKSNVSATCLVKVTDSYVAVVSVAISSEDPNYNATSKTLTLQSVKRAKGQLVATVGGEDGEQPSEKGVKWSVVSGSEHITVSSDGLVTVTTNLPYGSENLSAKVRAESLENSSIKDECDIVITPNEYIDTTVHVDHIAFEKAEESLAIGQKETTVMLNFFGEGGALTNYIDADFEIIDRVGAADATIEKRSGNSVKIVSGTATGSFKIKATSKDKLTTATEFPTATITVTIFDPIKHVAEIVLDSSISGFTQTNPGVFYKGDTISFGPLATASTGEPGVDPTNGALQFAVSSTTYALIDSLSGYTQFVKAGEVQVIIKSVQDPSVSVTLYLLVKEIPVNRVVMENTHTLTMDASDNHFTLTPSVFYKHPNKVQEEALTSNEVTFSVVSGSDVVSVNNDGVVTALSIGTAVVRATAIKANSSDEDVYAECTVKVVDNIPLIVNYLLPNSMMVYESKANVNNMNDTADLLADSSKINKGSYYKYSSKDPDDADVINAQNEELTLYKVGSQGEFKYSPIAIAQLDPAHSSATSQFPDAILTKELKKYNDSTKEYETISNLSTYASFTDNGLQLTDDAIGERFQLIFKAKEDSAYEINTTAGNSTLEFEVVNAYNAYDVAGLSVFDNHKMSSASYVDWETIRSASGVSLSESNLPEGVVLHNDIAILESNLPDSMKWTKDEVDNYTKEDNDDGYDDFTKWMGMVGITDEKEAREFLYNTPNDYTTIFLRNSTGDDNFTVDGNFFNVDYSVLKPIVLEYENDPGETLQNWLEAPSGSDGSHSQVFGINTDSSYQNSGLVNPNNTVTFQRIGMIGNGGISTPYQGVNATHKELLSKGGYISIKAGYVTLNVDNMINKGAFTSFIIEKNRTTSVESSEHHYTSSNVTRSTLFDTFSSAFYYHGTIDNTISDSYMTESAGPLIVMDEAQIDNNRVYNQVTCDITNTYLYNPIAGDEAWFKSHTGSQGFIQDYIVNAGIPTTEGTGWDLSASTRWLGELIKGTELESNQVKKNITRKIQENEKWVPQINFIALDFNTTIFEATVNYTDTTRGSSCLTGQLNINNELEMDMSSTAKTMTDVGGGQYFPARTINGTTCVASGVIAQGGKGGVADGTTNQNLALLAQSNYVAMYLDIALSLWAQTHNDAWAAVPGGTICCVCGTFDYNTYWVPSSN